MTNLFKYGGPYEIAITQYGSTLADLPIRFARQFGGSFGAFDMAVGAVVGGLVLWGLVEYFTKKSPVRVTKSIPFIGKYLYKR